MPDNQVDIIIPVYRAAILTKVAIQSCLSLTEWPFHLWVADDCSRDEELNRYFATLPKAKVSVYHSDRRRGFGDLCNYIANQCAQAPFICFLNSDTQAMPFWLTRMMEGMLSDDKIGVVGAKLLYPPEREERAYKIQHCGVARNDDGLPYHIWRDEDYDYPPTLTSRYVNAVTGACFLVRRTCWEALHGFDRVYEFAQFEDIDYCWRARRQGWKVFLAANAVLFHYEHGTGESFVMAKHDANRSILIRRWRNLGSDEAMFEEAKPCSPS
jgi:GT2 family glycosyltransferase